MRLHAKRPSPEHPKNAYAFLGTPSRRERGEGEGNTAWNGAACGIRGRGGPSPRPSPRKCGEREKNVASCNFREGQPDLYRLASIHLPIGEESGIDQYARQWDVRLRRDVRPRWYFGLRRFLLPLPASGERVGVRGSADSPATRAVNIDRRKRV